MKNWITTPEQFVIILCQDPLSIHRQFYKKSPHQYVSFSVGKDKSNVDIVLEVWIKNY